MWPRSRIDRLFLLWVLSAGCRQDPKLQRPEVADGVVWRWVGHGGPAVEEMTVD
mgnify:CR=1 FL=1